MSASAAAEKAAAAAESHAEEEVKTSEAPTASERKEEEGSASEAPAEEVGVSKEEASESEIESEEDDDHSVDPEAEVVPQEDVEGLQNETGEMKIQADVYLSPAKTFESLGLPPLVLQNIYNRMKFTKPSMIQAEALPYIVSCQHLIAQAINGSGKTVAFLLGMIMRSDPEKKAPQALCILQTRELAIQTASVLAELIHDTPYKSFLMVDFDEYKTVSEQIILGTIGTISKYIDHQRMKLDDIKMLVLDEADTFAEQSRNALPRILTHLPRSTQSLLFSATFPDETREWADYMAPKAVKIVKMARDLTLKSVKQFFIQCDRKRKPEILAKLYEIMNFNHTIVFVNRKHELKPLFDMLTRAGHKVKILSSDLEHRERDQVMEDFRQAKFKVLLVSNVISRGIDIDTVTLVVNYEIPVRFDTKRGDKETYLHRVGRTGRMGRKGAAINMIDSRLEKDHLDYITKYFEAEIEELKMDDYEVLDKKLREAVTQ